MANPRRFATSELPVEVLMDGAHRRAAVRSDAAMVVLNWLTPDFERPPPHRHPFEQLAFVLTGRMEIEVEEQRFDVGSGDVLVIPAGAWHTARLVGEADVLNVDVFATVREDYLHLVEHQDADYRRPAP